MRSMHAFKMVVAITLFLALAACGSGGGGGGSETGIEFITITPSAATAMPSSTVYLTAMGNYTDGSTADITSSATWTSSNTSAATVELPGEILTGAEGTTTITASFKGVTNTIDLIVTTTPPAISSVGPTGCSDTPSTFTITGSDFTPSATVSFGGHMANSVTLIDPATIEATFTGGVPSATYDVEVTLGPGLSAILMGAIYISPRPPVSLVDSRIVSSLMNTPVTVFSEFNPDVAFVNVSAASDGTETPLTYMMRSSDVIMANVPDGLSPGEYGIQIYTTAGCSTGTQLDSLLVTDDTTVSLLSISTGYVSGTAKTRLTITANAQFVAVPEVYIYNSTSGQATVRLSGVEFVDNSTLTANVPAGSAPGLYDLVVVNPDGTAGVLAASVVVLEGAGPSVDDITPDYAMAGIDTAALLNGSDFNSPAVQLECLKPDTTSQIVSVTVNSFTSTTASLTIPGSTMEAGSTCLLEVENSDGGSTILTEAIGVRSPASVISSPWIAGPSMQEARQSPAMAATYVGDTGYLYAIGGDNASGTFSSTMEFAPVDALGNMGPWETSDMALPTGITNARAAIIGDYIFLVGGRTATGVSNRVYVSYVPAADDTRQIENYSAYPYDTAVGDLGPGTWLYQLSHLDYDGNETLTGETYTIKLPDNGRSYFVHLNAETKDGLGCRLYRTPSADLTPADMELLFEMATCNVTDDGQTATSPAVLPLESGAPGGWVEIAPLNTPRETHALTVAPSPSSDNTFYLYAIGGRNDDGLYLDSYEVAGISIDPTTGSYSVLSSWTLGTNTLAAARGSVSATYVSDKEAAPLTNGVIYIGPGMTTGQTIDTSIEYAGILSDGMLDTITAYSKTLLASGYSLFDTGGYLLVCGGLSGSPSAGCRSSDYTSVANWNATSFSLTETVINAGSTELGPFIFTAGGYNGSAASTTVNRAIK